MAKEIATLFVEFRGKFATFEADMGQLSKSFANIGKKAQRLGGQLSGIGSKLSTTVTAPIVGIATASLKMASDFQTSMSKVSALGEIFGNDLEKLKKQALELGASTQFSAQQVADGMAELAAAGFKTTQIYEAMPGVLDLAAAGLTSVDEAARITVNTLGAFGMAAGESGRVADVLARAAAEGTSTMEDLAESMKYVAPVSKAVGISFEETAAAITLLSNSGIKGSMSGTSLRMGMIRMVKPTKQARQVIEDLGLTLTDSEGKVKPLTNIIQQLADKNANLADVTKLVGVNAATAWMSLVNTGGEALGTMTAKMEAANGSAESMAAILRDNLGGSFEQMTGALETLAIALGEALTPAARSAMAAIQQLAEAGVGVALWFGNLNPVVQNLIIGFTALVAAIGPIVFVAGQLIMSFGAVFGLLSKLGPVVAYLPAVFSALAGSIALLFSPLGLLVTAVTAAIVVWYKWDEVKPILANAWDNVKAFGEGVLEAIKDMVAGVVDSVKAFSEGILDSFKNLRDQVLQIVGEMVTGIEDWFTGKFDAAKSAVSGFADDIEATFQGLSDTLWGNSIVPDMVEGIGDWFGKLGGLMVDPTLDAVGRVDSAFSGLADSVGSSFSSLFSNLGVGSKMSDMLGKGMGGIAEQLLGGGGGSSGFVGDLADKLLGGGKSDLLGEITDSLGLGGSGGGYFNLAEEIPDAMNFGGLEDVSGDLLGSFDDFESGIGGLTEGLDGINGYARPLMDSLNSLSSIGKDTASTFEGMSQIGGSALGAFLGGPVGAGVGGAVGEMVGSFLGGIFGGSKNPETMARKEIENWLQDQFKDKTVSFFNKEGQKEKFDNNFKFGSSKRFNEPDWAKEHTQTESFGTFDAIGKGLTKLLGITEDVGGQIGFILSENLNGNIDNARILMAELGVTQEQMTAAFVQSGEEGSMSWHAVEVALQGVSAAFGEGLSAVGDMAGGFQQIVDSGGDGMDAIHGIKNAAIEAGEAGVTSFDAWKQSLLAAGSDPAYVEAFFQALSSRGISSLEQIKEATTRTLGGVIADMESLSPALAEQWHLAQGEAQKYADTIAKIPDNATKNIELNVTANISGDARSALDLAGGSIEAQATPFAKGGLVNKPTFAMIGEAGPEAVLPLGALNGMIKSAAMQGGGGGSVYNIDARNASPGVEREILRALEMVERRATENAVLAVAEARDRGGNFSDSF